MRRTGLIILSLSILILFLPFSAMGGVVENPNYFALKAGIISPKSNDIGDFDTGFNGELSFGHFFRRNFALELGVGYFQRQASDTRFDPIRGYLKGDTTIRTVPLTLTAKGIYPTEHIDLFAAAGIGLYSAFAESDLSIGPLIFSSDDDFIYFGFQLGLGANYNITENVFFGIEGKYLWAGAKYEADLFIFGIPMQLEADLGGYTVTANIGLRF